MKLPASVRAAAVIGVGVLSLFVTTQVAHADQESGYKTCSTNHYVTAKAKGSGDVKATVASVTHSVHTSKGSIATVYNSDLIYARTNVAWLTQSTWDYDSYVSGVWCEHV